MIEINLLPEEMRRENRFRFNLDIEASKVGFLAGGVLIGFLIIVVILFSIGSSVRKGQTANLIKKEQRILPQKSEVEAVNKEIAVLNAKMAALQGIARRRYLWAEKLNQLSDMILQGIWFTRIYTDSGERLIIEGGVISKREEAMAAVGNFMKEIRGNEAFFKDFTNIKLESVQRKSLDERDVVDFRIVLYFK